MCDVGSVWGVGGGMEYVGVQKCMSTYTSECAVSECVCVVSCVRACVRV